jgi:hypothetical protein
MRSLMIALVAVAGIALATTSGATAAPAGGAAIAGAAGTLTLNEPVHCRPYRHWHPWGYGRGCGRVYYRPYRVHRHRVYRRHWRRHHRH